MDTAGRNGQNDEWSPVVALDSVTYAARSRGPADRKPILEDVESTGARASRTTGGTHDDKSTLV